MPKLLRLINQLEQQIKNLDQVNHTVSQGSVGWHIEHSLLVITQIVEGVRHSDPAKYNWEFNFKRLVVLGLNKIPRGKAKAPPSVLPIENLNQAHLLDSIKKAKNSLIELDACAPNQYFTHPFFAHLNVAPTKRFFIVHTTHHLKIIRDILKTN